MRNNKYETNNMKQKKTGEKNIQQNGKTTKRKTNQTKNDNKKCR